MKDKNFYISEEEKYHLKDEIGEQEIGCSLVESLHRAQTSKLFQVHFLIETFSRQRFSISV